MAPPPLTALSQFSARAPVPSVRSTADWNRVAPEVRSASFFSAKVENARFLDRAKHLIEQHLAEARDESGKLKLGSRAEFTQKMRSFMEREGMDTNYGDRRITNLASLNRLHLIFDTNVRQGYGYAHYSQGMSPLVLDRWPASQFVRLEDVEEPRPRHRAHEGDIRLKTDVAYWADYQNDVNIGGFGVPWSPFGFNSMMDVEDVPRQRAEALGLIAPGQPAFSPESERVRKTSPEETMQASTKTMDTAIRRELERQLRADDDRSLTVWQLEQEQESRDSERILYDQMDALNDVNAPPGEVDDIRRRLFDIEQERTQRGTNYVYRIGRGVGGILKFLGDKLFRRE